MRFDLSLVRFALFYSILYHIFRYRFRIASPSYLCNQIGESSCNIQRVVPQFGRFVVPWANMVVTVEVFARGENETATFSFVAIFLSRRIYFTVWVKLPNDRMMYSVIMTFESEVIKSSFP